MTTDTHLYSDLAIPPGEYLEEVIADLFSQVEAEQVVT